MKKGILKNLFNRYETKKNILLSVDSYAGGAYISQSKVLIPAKTTFHAEKYIKGDAEILFFEADETSCMHYVNADGEPTTKKFTGSVEILRSDCKRVWPIALIVGVISLTALIVTLFTQKRK